MKDDALIKTIDHLANGGERLLNLIEKTGLAMAKTAPGLWKSLVDYHRMHALGELVVTLTGILLCTIFSAVCVRALFKGTLWLKKSNEVQAEAKAEEERLEDILPRDRTTDHYRKKELLRELRADFESPAEFGFGLRVCAGLFMVILFIINMCLIHTIPHSFATYKAPERAAAVDILQAAGALPREP